MQCRDRHQADALARPAPQARFGISVSVSYAVQGQAASQCPGQMLFCCPRRPLTRLSALQCKDRQRSDALASMTSAIAALSSSSEVALLEPGQSVPSGCAPNVVDDAMIVYLLLTGILDPQKELDKLAKDQVGLRQLTGHWCS